MKYLIAIAFLIAGISALPQPEETDLMNERIVTGQIVDAINDVSQQIKDLGLDPLYIRSESIQYALPVPDIFNAAAIIENLLSFGLSDIRINRMSYSVLTFRLNFDLELPHIHISADNAYGEVNIFRKKLDARVSGGVEISSIRVVGQVNVSVGIISGISIRSISINFTLNSIYSHLRVDVLGYDLSDRVNTFLGETIPDTLLAFRSDIDRLLEIVLFDIIDGML